MAAVGGWPAIVIVCIVRHTQIPLKTELDLYGCC